jgi:hypothetical protein
MTLAPACRCFFYVQKTAARPACVLVRKKWQISLAVARRRHVSITLFMELSLLQKTTAMQLSDFISPYLSGIDNLLSLIFSRLAIVNPSKANKFVLLFKY